MFLELAAEANLRLRYRSSRVASSCTSLANSSISLLLHTGEEIQLSAREFFFFLQRTITRIQKTLIELNEKRKVERKVLENKLKTAEHLLEQLKNADGIQKNGTAITAQKEAEIIPDFLTGLLQTSTNNSNSDKSSSNVVAPPTSTVSLEDLELQWDAVLADTTFSALTNPSSSSVDSIFFGVAEQSPSSSSSASLPCEDFSLESLSDPSFSISSFSTTEILPSSSSSSSSAPPAPLFFSSASYDDVSVPIAPPLELTAHSTQSNEQLGTSIATQIPGGPTIPPSSPLTILDASISSSSSSADDIPLAPPLSAPSDLSASESATHKITRSIGGTVYQSAPSLVSALTQQQQTSQPPVIDSSELKNAATRLRATPRPSADSVISALRDVTSTSVNPAASSYSLPSRGRSISVCCRPLVCDSSLSAAEQLCFAIRHPKLKCIPRDENGNPIKMKKEGEGELERFFGEKLKKKFLAVRGNNSIKGSPMRRISERKSRNVMPQTPGETPDEWTTN